MNDHYTCATVMNTDSETPPCIYRKTKHVLYENWVRTIPLESSYSSDLKNIRYRWASMHGHSSYGALIARSLKMSPDTSRTDNPLVCSECDIEPLELASRDKQEQSDLRFVVMSSKELRIWQS